MSGGRFDYDQYRIRTIWETIQSEIGKNNQPVKSRDRWGDWDTREVYSNYSDETIAEFEKAVHYLKLAEIYAQRVDWLLSGDDGEESFHKRLKEELSKLV